MRKVFAVALALLLALVGMSASALAAAETSLTKGNSAILFSNNYTGFCIDNALASTDDGYSFQTASADAAVSNVEEYNSEKIDQYLKAAVILYHQDFFPRNADGGYYDAFLGSSSGSVTFSKLCWIFSDKAYKSITEDMSKDEFESIVGLAISYNKRLCEIVEKVQDFYNSGVRIDDNGVITYANGNQVSEHKIGADGDETTARFRFMVMDSDNDEVQDFFAFKVTYYREIEVDKGENIVMKSDINSSYVSYEWAQAQSEDASFSELTDVQSGTHSIVNAQMSENGKLYRCTVKDYEYNRYSDKYYPHYNVEYIYKVKVNSTDPAVEWDCALQTSVPDGTKNFTLKVKPENVASYKWIVKDKDNNIIKEVSDTLTYTIPEVKYADHHGVQFVVEGYDASGEKVASTDVYQLNVAQKCEIPMITLPEQDKTYLIAAGESKELIVQASGATKCQWSVLNPETEEFDEIETVSGSEQFSYTATPQSDAVYRCTVSNECSQQTASVTFTVKVLKINWDSKPTGTVNDKASFFLTVNAENEKSLQWYVDRNDGAGDQPISGATGATLTLTADGSENGNNGYVYSCVATNDTKSVVTSPKFKLNVAMVCVPPTITSPAEENSEYHAKAGEEVTLCIKAQNANSYTWEVKTPDAADFAPTDVGNGATCPVGAVGLQDNGTQYRCTITSACGASVVRTIILLVTEDEESGDQPEYVPPTGEQVIPFMAGDDVTMTMPTEGGEGMRFAWYAIGDDGEPVLLAGYETDTFTIDDCASEHDGAVLVCVAEDAAGNTSSLAFRLVMTGMGGELPNILSPKEHEEISFIEGESITLSITAERADGYQWFVDKGDGKLTRIDGANESSYTITAISGEQDGWVYLCEASNEIGAVLSKAFIMCKLSVPAMPKTGDDSALFVWMGLMACAMVLGAAIMRRRGTVR